MKNSLLLGVSRKIITPKVGGNLMGYAPDVYSETVNDDLTVASYYFKSGDTVALMISATLCVISSDIAEPFLEEIEKKFSIPKDNIILHTMHTHSGPILCNIPGWGSADYEYIETIFRPALMESVEEAISLATPVTMATARGETKIGCNRRQLKPNNTISLGQNPWGPFDPKMTIISFKNEEGKVVANMVHYGAHATASGRNHEITRDWPGPMIDTLDENLGGITAFFNGPEGDVGPRMPAGTTTGGLIDGKHISHVRYALQMGSFAASEATAISKSMSGYSDADLQVSTKYIDIPLKPRISLEEAEAVYEANKPYTSNLPARKKAYAEEVIKSYKDGYTDIEKISFRQTIIRIGDVAFVSFPYELFSEMGLRIARASKIPYTLSLALTNGSEGYFPTEADLCRGGYEVDSFKVKYIQPYVDDADFHLVKNTLAHLETLGYDKHPEKAFEFDENATK